MTLLAFVPWSTVCVVRYCFDYVFVNFFAPVQFVLKQLRTIVATCREECDEM
jgi:hypothetical protein